MNKIKKFWNENRVMFVLGIIVVICIIIILVVMFQYFFGVTASNYGNRLDDIKSVSFDDDTKKSLEDAFASEHLIHISIDVKGKIIYVITKYDDTVSLVEAQSKAMEVYSTIDEKYQKLYDFNITLLQDATEGAGGYRLMGAKNVSSENFIWSNNTSVEEEE